LFSKVLHRQLELLHVGDCIVDARSIHARSLSGIVAISVLVVSLPVLLLVLLSSLLLIILLCRLPILFLSVFIFTLVLILIIPILFLQSFLVPLFTLAILSCAIFPVLSIFFVPFCTTFIIFLANTLFV